MNLSPVRKWIASFNGTLHCHAAQSVLKKSRHTNMLGTWHCDTMVLCMTMDWKGIVSKPHRCLEFQFVASVSMKLPIPIPNCFAPHPGVLLGAI